MRIASTRRSNFSDRLCRHSSDPFDAVNQYEQWSCKLQQKNFPMKFVALPATGSEKRRHWMIVGSLSALFALLTLNPVNLTSLRSVIRLPGIAVLTQRPQVLFHGFTPS